MQELGNSRAEKSAEGHVLALPPRRQSPEARLLGEALVATINAHMQRYPTTSWAEVRAVLRVLERAAMGEVLRETSDASTDGPIKEHGWNEAKR